MDRQRPLTNDHARTRLAAPGGARRPSGVAALALLATLAAAAPPATAASHA